MKKNRHKKNAKTELTTPRTSWKM